MTPSPTIRHKRVGKKKRDWSNLKLLIYILLCLIFASLKFKFENTVKSTKSNLKEEELEAVARRCSSI